MSLEAGYAHALYDLQKSRKLDGAAAVSKLIKVLKRKGHLKLLPRIVDEFEKILGLERNKHTMRLTCANETDFEKYKETLKEHFAHSGAEFTEEVVDENIIGGFVLEKGEVVIDGSYKKKLLLLYQSALA